jgi:hypothetical protein
MSRQVQNEGRPGYGELVSNAGKRKYVLHQTEDKSKYLSAGSLLTSCRLIRANATAKIYAIHAEFETENVFTPTPTTMPLPVGSKPHLPHH